MAVGGVILDSGHVLVRPVGGSWFPPPAFRSVLEARGVAWAGERLGEAVAAAGAYLDEVHAVPLADEDGERSVWLRYYELLLAGVGAEGDAATLAAAIHQEWDAAPPMEPYPWTVPVLRALRDRGIPVVVLSDAWPSLRRHYRELDLAPYVSGMVISAEEGRTKPDRRVYEQALALLGRDPAEVLFVDYGPDNVLGAVAVGMRGLRLRHEGAEPEPAVEEITDLGELLTHL